MLNWPELQVPCGLEVYFCILASPSWRLVSPFYMCRKRLSEASMVITIPQRKWQSWAGPFPYILLPPLGDAIFIFWPSCHTPLCREVCFIFSLRLNSLECIKVTWDHSEQWFPGQWFRPQTPCHRLALC